MANAVTCSVLAVPLGEATIILIIVSAAKLLLPLVYYYHNY